MDDIHSNQSTEVLPYQFEPEFKPDDVECESDGGSDDSLSSSSETENFEEQNAWRLQTLDWCKCGVCKPSPKAIECFCCHEKALEYDEYDGLLTEAEGQGHQCITSLSDF